MMLGMIGWGALTGIVMTVLIAGLEYVLSMVNNVFEGMVGTMIGGGFSAPTLAFLMTATSLFALLTLLLEGLSKRIPQRMLERFRSWAPARSLDCFKEAVASIYNSIVFGVGFLLGGFVVAFGLSLYTRKADPYSWGLLFFILFTMTFLLFATNYAVKEFRGSEDSRGLWWLTVAILLIIALITIPVVHRDLKIQERTAAGASRQAGTRL